MRRDEYIDHFRYWFRMIDGDWDEGEGLYASKDTGNAVTLNASMLSCLAVMGLEGDREKARRIPRIIERLIATPPWDPEYHYWNFQFDRLGTEPHAGMYSVGGWLAAVCRYRGELGVPPDLMEKAMDRVELLTAKTAEYARRAAEMPFNCYVDANGKVADAGEIRRDAIRRGVPEDLRWLREGGPSNQLVELLVAALAYLGSGREAFWELARFLWNRIIEKVEKDKPFLFRSCMDPDYSFIYENSPSSEHGVHTHRYTQYIYAIQFLFYHANAVRIARSLGRSEQAWEEIVRRSAEAVFSRALFRDGTGNMVFNAYGWERSVMPWYCRAYSLHTLVPIADLTPFTPGQLARMVNASFRTLRELSERGRLDSFPTVLGLKGFHRGGESQYVAQTLAGVLADLILMNPEAMGVEEDPEAFSRCYSGFAWAQKHFVMQTSSYSLTMVGAGTPYFPERGNLGLGMITSGGEYVIKIPGGPFLTPLCDSGRTLMSARVEGKDIRSSDVTFFNKEAHDLRMEVILPDGTRIDRGEDFGPPPFDPTVENIGVETGFEKNGIRLARRIDFSPHSVKITDSLRVLADVEVEDWLSRLPLITVDPMGDCARISAVAQGRPVEIRPPCHMGYSDGIQHYDQDFIPSISGIERLEVSYPSGFGFLFERLDTAPVRLTISRGEWHENRRMRVEGKNLDFHWIRQPVKLRKGGGMSFSYRITPRKTQ